MTVLLVTNHVPPDRARAFAELHAREGLELALFGGRSHHATEGLDDPGVPHRHVSQREVFALASSGRYRAVIAGTAGRTALPAAYLGARRAGVPFVLWTALWAHPRTPAFLVAGAPLLRHLYRHADAVVTYGPHVSDFVRARGARRVVVAPQAVDPDAWRPAERPQDGVFRVCHVGREAGYKGVQVLFDAWRKASLGSTSELLLVGSQPPDVPPGTRAVGPQAPEAVRNFLTTADVLVLPALATRTFREPWGLVANEAMHLGLPVIATNAVGAAAGGLVRHERNGLVVPTGGADALAGAITRLRDDRDLRARLGAAAARDVTAFSTTAWAAGVSHALSAATAHRSPTPTPS